MKRKLIALATVAISGCLLVSLAACGGAVSEAKNMRGEEVTEDVWNSAMAGTKYRLTSAAKTVPAQTVADVSVTLPNYKAEFEMDYNVSFETEAFEGGIVSVEAMSASVSQNASATVVVADNALYVKLKYDFKLDGSENLLELMGMSEAPSGSGETEIYLAPAEAGGYAVYGKDADGNWQVSYGTSSLVGDAAQYIVQMTMSLMDQSALAGAFAQYEYNGDLKGYTAINASSSGSIGGVSGSASGNLVYKFRDDRLAAIYGETGYDSSSNGAAVSGSAEVGIVYTYGGQSITLPAVA